MNPTLLKFHLFSALFYEFLFNVYKFELKDWNFKNTKPHSILVSKIMNVQAES